MTPLRRRPRPRRALGPVAGTVAGLAVWAAVAHNSGSGWVQAVGVLMGAGLAVGLLAPALVVRRAGVRAIACPADAVAGQRVEVLCEVSSPLRLVALSPRGEATVSGRNRTCTLVWRLDHRGVVPWCRVELASAAPFGLLWWSRQVNLELPRPVTVSPRVGPPAELVGGGARQTGDQGRRVPARVGEPRGVRPYKPGDLRHWVNWSATAHVGDLMVREMEGPTDPPVTVEAILPADPVAAERAAERALGTVARHLAHGASVILVTDEVHGRVAAPVASPREAGRRLARAVGSPGSAVPAPVGMPPAPVGMPPAPVGMPPAPVGVQPGEVPPLLASTPSLPQGRRAPR